MWDTQVGLMCYRDPPTFQKSELGHFAFKKDPWKDLFSLAERNPRTIFTFTKEGEK